MGLPAPPPLPVEMVPLGVPLAPTDLSLETLHTVLDVRRRLPRDMATPRLTDTTPQQRPPREDDEPPGLEHISGEEEIGLLLCRATASAETDADTLARAPPRGTRFGGALRAIPRMCLPRPLVLPPLTLVARRPRRPPDDAAVHPRDAATREAKRARPAVAPPLVTSRAVAPTVRRLPPSPHAPRPTEVSAVELRRVPHRDIPDGAPLRPPSAMEIGRPGQLDYPN